MKAEEIQVDVDGRSLRISRDTSAKMSREDNFDDGRGYMRSFSYSSGRSNRRIPLPSDADGAAMQRQDSPEQVRILIPRRKG
jgi:HSP20 family molecular chaperone IbpA